MGKWSHAVNIKHILEDESAGVAQKGVAIAGRLRHNPGFERFPFIPEFHAVTSEKELEMWLSCLYDYADRHHIWII